MNRTDHKDAFELCKANEESGYKLNNMYCECSEENYDYWVGVLPPIRHKGTAFLSEEPIVTGRYYGTMRIKDRYFFFVCNLKDFEKTVDLIKSEEMTDLEKIKEELSLKDEEVSNHESDLYIKLSPDHPKRGAILSERYQNVSFFIADDGSGTWAELPFFLIDDIIARRNKNAARN